MRRRRGGLCGRCECGINILSVGKFAGALVGWFIGEDDGESVGGWTGETEGEFVGELEGDEVGGLTGE